MFNKIIVVCVGNICRSPTAERLLKRELPNVDVSSAGLGALKGHCADKDASTIAEMHGLSLDGHIAQQLNKKHCQSSDLILVMEKWQIEEVCKISPESRGKTMLIGHWNNQQEIPDPYRKNMEAFEFVYNQLEQAIKKWALTLSR